MPSPAPAIHYAPTENLEHIDVALIDGAQHVIDMAAYLLTDWPVMQALTRAADRGVHIRIYLDGAQLAEREPAKVFHDLAETPGVEIRTKRKSSDPMHLKSYQIDGRFLRTGARELFRIRTYAPRNEDLTFDSSSPRMLSHTCPPDMYSNSLHHCVPRPDDCAHQKPGELPVTAICNDGTCSHSQHRAGTCSSHHGVEHFTPAAQL